MQAALEAEITEFLGRDPYHWAAACQDAPPGPATGTGEVTVKTKAEPMQQSPVQARPDRLPAVPDGHQHRIRHSNFIERPLGETRRRTKVIGRLPGETSCLTLVWAVLDSASCGWRGLTMTSDGLRLL
jgi:hypothetical protein